METRVLTIRPRKHPLNLVQRAYAGVRDSAVRLGTVGAFVHDLLDDVWYVPSQMNLDARVSREVQQLIKKTVPLVRFVDTKRNNDGTYTISITSKGPIGYDHSKLPREIIHANYAIV